MRSAILQKHMNKTRSQQWAARRFGVSVMTIWQWRQLGMPCIVLKGESRPVVRFIVSEATQWVRKHRKEYL